MNTQDPNLDAPKSIEFSNGNQAELVIAPPKSKATDILATLGITRPTRVIVVCGSTIQLEPPKLKNRIKDLLSRGVAKAAVETNAMIIDGGTQAGVIELIGQGVLDRERKPTLLGVAPSGKVTYPGMPAPQSVQDGAALDPNHSHFVLVESDHWGGETEMLFQLAKTAAGDDNSILTILAGGNPTGVTLDEALATVRHSWPLVVLEGTGRLADQIARLYKTKNRRARRKGRGVKLLSRLPGLDSLTDLKIEDPRLSEIIQEGEIIIVSQSAEPGELRSLLEKQIAPPPPHKEDLLYFAWKRFAEYDLNSKRHRDNWERLKKIPLYLGVLTTLLVLVFSASTVNIVPGEQSSLWVQAYSDFMGWLAGLRNIPVLDLAFRFIIILLPISISIILGIETRFKLGSKYILLRGAAESVKRGIYSYRTLPKMPAPANLPTSPEPANPPPIQSFVAQLPGDDPELAAHLAGVSKILLDSDVNEAAFKPYKGRIPPDMYGGEAYDDGYSSLQPSEYIHIRIGDQLGFFTSRTNQYETQLRRLRVWILVLGGVGTFLAAIGAQYWLPLTGSIVTAMTAYLEYRQIEQMLVKYNLTKASLENWRNRWQTLSEPEQNNPENINNLVREVEAILESENQGWVQYVKQTQENQKPPTPEKAPAETQKSPSADTTPGKTNNALPE